MEPKGSLLHSQAPAVCPYHEPEQSCPCLQIQFLKMYFYVILPPNPRSSKWSCLGSLHQNPVYTCAVPHLCHMLHSLHSSWFDHQHDRCGGVQSIRLLFMQSSSLSCHLVPPKTKYLPQPVCPSLLETRPHTHTKQQEKLQFYIFGFLRYLYISEKINKRLYLQKHSREWSRHKWHFCMSLNQTGFKHCLLFPLLYFNLEIL
jgi:hypothetical protein